MPNFNNITYIIQGPIDRNKAILLNNIEQGLCLGCKVIVSCLDDCNTDDISKLPITIFKSPNYYTPTLRNLKNQLTTTVKGLEATETEFALKIRSDEKYSVEPFIQAALEAPDKYTTCNIFFLHPSCNRYLLAPSDHLIFCKTETMKRGWRLALDNVESFPNSGHRDECFIFRHWLMANGIDPNVNSHNVFRDYTNCVDIDLLKPYEWRCNNITYTNSDYLYNNGYNYSIRNIKELDER